MALYRTISTAFWEDSNVIDEFTPEDRYFYLYLFTNPHTNLCGCYELSIKQAALETGYSTETIMNLIKRFETVHKVLAYSSDTKEILLLNWYKHNWTPSIKFRTAVAKEMSSVKDAHFREFLQCAFDGGEPKFEYPIDRVSEITDRVSEKSDTLGILAIATANAIANANANANSNAIANTNTSSKTKAVSNKQTEEKKQYGSEFHNVMLTEKEYMKLIDKYGQAKLDEIIDWYDLYLVEEDKKPKSKQVKSHYAAILRWVARAVEEHRQRGEKSKGIDYSDMDNWLAQTEAMDEQGRIFTVG